MESDTVDKQRKCSRSWWRNIPKDSWIPTASTQLEASQKTSGETASKRWQKENLKDINVLK